MDEIAHRILSAFDQLSRVSLNVPALIDHINADSPQSRAILIDALPELVNAGLLHDDGSGFFSRTEDGRLAVAPQNTITLYTRPGCHLCDDAKTIIARLASEFGAQLYEVDIDRDPLLRARYTNDVPVIFVGPRLLSKLRLDPARLRRALQAPSR